MSSSNDLVNFETKERNNIKDLNVIEESIERTLLFDDDNEINSRCKYRTNCIQISLFAIVGVTVIIITLIVMRKIS